MQVLDADKVLPVLDASSLSESKLFLVLANILKKLKQNTGIYAANLNASIGCIYTAKVNASFGCRQIVASVGCRIILCVSSSCRYCKKATTKNGGIYAAKLHASLNSHKLSLRIGGRTFPASKVCQVPAVLVISNKGCRHIRS